MFKSLKAIRHIAPLNALRIASAFLPIVTLFIAAAPARAQDEKAVLATLPQPAQTVLERLGSLSNLPAGTWKTHSGDLPHGEAVNLDESNWQPIAENGKAQQEAIWLRQTVEVPKTLRGYDLTGARIWFQLRMDGDGPMPQIVYFNGRRVAMGEDLEPLVLLDNVRAGDKVVVAVKVLHTESTKTFVGATFHVEFAENRPNPGDLRTEFLSAAWLIPSLVPSR